MGGAGQPHRRVILVLCLIVILSPTIIESEIFGAGEHMVLDAVFYQTRYEGVCWAFEWNSSSALVSQPDTFEFLLPYINPVALLGTIVGILSLVGTWLALSKKISLRSGLLVIVLTSIVLIFAPGINSLRIEEFYTYRMQPLLVPQIASALVLLWFSRSKTNELIE